jgi:curved DNA-binding protein CbpA
MAEQSVRREWQQPNLYDVLQVSPTADLEVIHASYRALARRYHPDLNAAPEAALRMRQLNAAYDVLRDSEQRARYDAQHKRFARATGARRRRPETSYHRREWTSSLRVVDRSLASSAGRVRLMLIIAVLMASFALALWLFSEAIMDTPWTVFLV